MSSQDKVRIFSSSIQEFPKLLEKVKALALIVESKKESMTEEWPLLLKIKASLIDKKWFHEVWEEYLALKKSGLEDCLILFKLKSNENIGFTWIQFAIIDPINHYLRKNKGLTEALRVEVVVLFQY